MTIGNILRAIKSQAELELERLKLQKYYPTTHNNLDVEAHIREAAAWLCRAQDSGEDRGVAYGAEFGKGFMPSYPETTGYIIPTFLRLHELYGNTDFLRRAIEMGDWEIEVQMESGAVMGGMIGEVPSPTVFNTGQVVLGWNSLYSVTGETRFLDASERACEWLTGIQDANGNWTKFNSRFARSDTTVYNVRAAWAVGQFGKITDRMHYVDAAAKNAEFALTQQRENGWFMNCCLDDPQKPLLHTLAYTMRGLLEIGALTGKHDFVEASARTAKAVMGLMEEDGFIPGRIDADFQGAVSYACMTGCAQTSIIWSKLYRQTKDTLYRDAAVKVNKYLMQRHDLTSAYPTVRGGITGSWPAHGGYGRFKTLNWATKFFIDALLEQKESEKLS